MFPKEEMNMNKKFISILIKYGDGAINVIGARDGGNGGRRLREPVS